jgi:hypothetical protein
LTSRGARWVLGGDFVEVVFESNACPVRIRYRVVSKTSLFMRESRIYLVDPAPIPADELQRTFDWMKSWGFLKDVCEARELVNMSVQQRAYEEPSHQHAAVG